MHSAAGDVHLAAPAARAFGEVVRAAGNPVSSASGVMSTVVRFINFPGSLANPARDTVENPREFLRSARNSVSNVARVVSHVPRTLKPAGGVVHRPGRLMESDTDLEESRL